MYQHYLEGTPTPAYFFRTLAQRSPGANASAAQQSLELLAVCLDTPLWLVPDLRMVTKSIKNQCLSMF